jgi:hypothetical protein
MTDRDDIEACISFGRGRVLDLREMPPAFVASHLLLTFVEDDSYVIDTPLQQLVVATFLRSTETFRAVLSEQIDGRPTQAAMLARALFEDVIVGHWLALNADDPDWLGRRFFDHREAMALYQKRLARETAWQITPVAGADLAAATRRQNLLFRQFGSEAQRNWWDPGERGHGNGRPIGVRGVAALLEEAAHEHRMFHPRFAGGEEPLLRRMELVVQKWFSQSLHHTAVGLPVVIRGASEAPGEPDDPSGLVAFTSWWMYAQQIYLLHDFYGRPPDEFNERVRFGFVEAFGASEGDLKPFPY